MIWLASYPKSGNTWVRSLLSNYLQAGDHPVSINQLMGRSIHIDRHLFDETMGISSSDLIDDEVAHYRPIFHDQLCQLNPGQGFVKTHDAFYRRETNRPLFSAIGPSKAIYIVRNPLDIIPSYAHHQGRTLDHIVAFMADEHSYVRGGQSHFDQHLGTWSDHVSGWISQKNVPVLPIKYESLLSDTLGTFRGIIDFCQLELDETRIRKAVEFASFQRLQANEAAEGFCEKRPASPSFFRQGRAGDGHRVLSSSQIETVMERHDAMMTRFSYV